LGIGDRGTVPSLCTPFAACQNGVDDDGDGGIDHPADPGCPSPTDASETNPAKQCDDGLDNDADGAVSCDEFVLWLTATSLDAAAARRTFEESDLDGDGLLSKSELGFILLEFFYSSDPEQRGSWLLEL